MSTPLSGSFLGVLGGMGPLAGASFLARLVQLTAAESDQQHLPVILWSDPRIPSRTATYVDASHGPLPWMVHGLQQLEQLGVKSLVIPCNTAHLWFDTLQASVQIPVLHIVQSVSEDLNNQGIAAGRVGLLATQATLQSELYQTRLSQAGYICILPEREMLEQACIPAIALVKKNHLEQASKRLLPALRRFVHEHELDTVVLACTELPLAFPHSMRADFAVPVIDSIDALAKTALRWFGK